VRIRTMTIAAAAIIATASVAGAATNKKDDVTYLYSGDIWYTYKTTGDEGNPICGMTVTGKEGKKNSMIVNIKNVTFDDGSDGLYFMINKSSWRFPKDGSEVSVPLTIDFDDKKDVVDAKGAGSIHKMKDGDKLPVVEFTVQQEKEGQLEGFLDIFGHADTMVVKFKAGNEEPWTIPMRGSRDAVNAFSKCLAQLNASRDSQPYSPKAKEETQPWETKETTAKKGHDI
jgi:hypothetical protein